MSDNPPSTPNLRVAPGDRWDATYQTRGSTGVSWYQSEPAVSLELIQGSGISHDAAIIDVGGGASMLVDDLVGLGFNSVSVLDISAVALAEARARLEPAKSVRWIHQDLLTFEPSRPYDLWHDRAVFHFLIAESDRRAYRDVLLSSLAPGGFVIIGAFAEDGPTQCSGLSVSRYSGQDLGQVLGDQFELHQTRRELHQTPSGGTQPFTWVMARRLG